MALGLASCASMSRMMSSCVLSKLGLRLPIAVRLTGLGLGDAGPLRLPCGLFLRLSSGGAKSTTFFIGVDVGCSGPAGADEESTLAHLLMSGASLTGRDQPGATFESGAAGLFAVLVVSLTMTFFQMVSLARSSAARHRSGYRC
jgi:hypothetical protein